MQSDLNVFITRLWSSQGRGEARCRGDANHAHPGQQHGMAPTEDSRRRRVRPSAREATCIYEFHKIGHEEESELLSSFYCFMPK